MHVYFKRLTATDDFHVFFRFLNEKHTIWNSKRVMWRTSSRTSQNAVLVPRTAAEFQLQICYGAAPPGALLIIYCVRAGVPVNCVQCSCSSLQCMYGVAPILFYLNVSTLLSNTNLTDRSIKVGGNFHFFGPLSEKLPSMHLQSRQKFESRSHACNIHKLKSRPPELRVPSPGSGGTPD